MVIDTHCHLNFKAFEGDCADVVHDMRNQNVRGIVVGSQFTTSQRAVDLAHRYPDILYAAVALHPLHLHARFVDEVEIPFHTRAENFNETEYEALAADPKVVAIGECGLDYYKIPESVAEAKFKEDQKNIFLQQIALSRKIGKPLILHARSHPSNYVDAHEDLFALLETNGRPKAVWHALATHPDVAKKILDAGYLVGYTGLITYPKFREALEACVRRTPLEQMVIETDAPYMTPHPNEKNRNTPLNVLIIAEAVAKIKQVSIADVIDQTTKNVNNFFGI